VSLSTTVFAVGKKRENRHHVGPIFLVTAELMYLVRYVLITDAPG